MGSNWNESRQHTLCWDCANATSFDCPWVDRGEPVPGWWAKPTKLARKLGALESYLVLRCPMFERDAENGGQKKWEPKPSKLEYEPLKGESGDGDCNSSEHSPADAENRMAESGSPRNVDGGSSRVVDQRSGKTRCAIDERDTEQLAYAILERAVLDWKALEYGAKASALQDSYLINRKEVVRFFFGEWFSHLVDLTPWSEDQFRRLIKMPPNAMEILECGNPGREFTYAYEISKIS